MLEMAARSHCSKKLLAVELCSATPLLCSPLLVHGYASVHSHSYIFIYIYIYIERERERDIDNTYTCFTSHTVWVIAGN